jgi:hypothetical protein
MKQRNGGREILRCRPQMEGEAQVAFFSAMEGQIRIREHRKG